jgi:hypothetical protein
MESISIILTQKVNNETNGFKDVYSLSLTKTLPDGITRYVNMPIEIESEDGALIKSLVNKAWNFVSNAEPDELSQAKAKKLQSINNSWSVLEKTGWDSGQGFSLGITSSDVALLVGVFSLAKEAAALGLPLPSLISTTNTTVSFNNIQEMTNLLLQYGQARSALADAFAAKRKAVADATTVEEVNAVA